jgi:hypothetical protein
VHASQQPQSERRRLDRFSLEAYLSYSDSLIHTFPAKWRMILPSLVCGLASFLGVNESTMVS